MMPSKGTFAPGQAYVAFSRVRQLEKLHIVNYTRTQIKVSLHVADEMDRLRTNCVPQIQHNLFEIVKSDVNIVHINVGNIYRKIDDMKQDSILQNSNIISINETHLSIDDVLSAKMMHLSEEMEIFHNDRNTSGGGVALIVNKKFNPVHINIDTCCEVCAVMIHCTIEIILISVYRPLSTSICEFTEEMSKVISVFEDMNVCVMGDFNEDILVSDAKKCCMMFKCKGYKQFVNKPTRDSGTLIDHMYATPGLHLRTDVSDCYYSDHDYVLCTINK